MLRFHRTTICLLAAIASARCGNDGPKQPLPSNTTLRVGVGGLPSLSAERGIQQFIGNLSREGLLRVNQSGRIEATLAESLSQSPDGLQFMIRLRPNLTFHDGSVVDGKTVVALFEKGLPAMLGSVAEDIESITAPSARGIVIRLHKPSPFVADTLMDVPLVKNGASPSATGAYVMAPKDDSNSKAIRMTAFDGYYLGPPKIKTIEVTTYASVRAAWADMLRDRVDMLYETGTEALDSMAGAKNVALYSVDRPYQFIVFLNPKLPKFRAREIRRALNQAIDRNAIVRDGLGGHGTPSAGPVSPHHWAFAGAGSTFTFAPAEAANAIRQVSNGRFSFTCLTAPVAPYDHLALVLKQQLQAADVDMSINEVSPDDAFQTLAKGQFEALLTDAASGWSLIRAYKFWHSNGPSNMVGFSSASIDTALESVRHAADEQTYRQAVADFQHAVDEDPPAIFLAWGDRSRAVSRSFEVQTQPGRDVLGTLSSWRPLSDNRNATRH